MTASLSGKRTIGEQYDPFTSDRHWLLRYVRLQKEKDKEVSKILSEAKVDVEKELKKLTSPRLTISESVRKSQLIASKKAIASVITTIYRQMGPLIKSGMEDSAALAENLMFEDEKELWEWTIPDAKVRKEIRNREIARARRNIQATVTRNQHIRRPLSNRIYASEALQRGIVDRKINLLMARGATVEEIAKDVRPYFQEEVPGGVTFAAKRLARSELNNAFHAQSIQDMKDRPWIKNAYWNLSKSHSVDVIECLCDRYAMRRVFPIDEIPEKPHPQCLCSITPEIPSLSEMVVSYDMQKWSDR